MPSMTRDQIRHEAINLQKTLNLLERTFKEEDWTRWSSKDRNNKWLKAQSILTGVSHCRGVLQTLTPSDYDYGLGDRRSMSGQQFHENAEAILERLEQEISDVKEDLKPRARRPTPILPTLPRPLEPSVEKKAPSVQEEEERARDAMGEILVPEDESESTGQITTQAPDISVETEAEESSGPSAPSTLPTRLGNPASTLIPPSIPSPSELSSASGRGSSSNNNVPGALKTSTALHEDLSRQLAQMATQLRRNAEQFSEALAKDAAVVNSTQEKIERNYDEVSKERVRLRDHSAKSLGTTCFTIAAIIVVVIAFFMTYLVIRVT